MQTVEYAKYGAAKCGASYYAVVNDNESVSSVYRSVCNVINMRGKIIADVTLGNKCSQFYVFDCYFFPAYAPIQNRTDILVGEDAVLRQGLESFCFLIYQPFLYAVYQTIKGNFGRVGYERKHGVVQVVVNGFQYWFYKHFPK